MLEMRAENAVAMVQIAIPLPAYLIQTTSKWVSYFCWLIFTN